MKNVLLLPVLLLVSLSANAELCSEITDDAQRLTCFDRQSRCAVIEDTRERLVCFDNRSHWARTEQLPEEIQSPMQSQNPTVPPVVTDPEPLAQAQPVPPAAPPAVVEAETPIEPEIESESEAAVTSVDETETTPATTAELEEAFPVRDAPRRKEDKPEPVVLNASISDVYRDGRSLAIITLDNGQIWREIRKSRFNYRTGLDVTISVGVMGSNNLKANGMKKFVKVKRLK